MKKIIVSVIIIGTFVIYSFIHAHSGLVAVVPNTSTASRSSSSSATAPSSTAAPGATATSGATSTPGSLYKDGSYTGSVADAQWGVVQVKAVIKNGKITDVQFLQYPNDRNRSIDINSYRRPAALKRSNPGTKCQCRYRNRCHRFQRCVHAISLGCTFASTSITHETTPTAYGHAHYRRGS